MSKLKLQVGHYYELKLFPDRRVVFAVLYGFEKGKNKDIYTVRMFTGKGDFEFPIEESTFERWVRDGNIKEITADEALAFAL
jgi:hypothetical protein